MEMDKIVNLDKEELALQAHQSAEQIFRLRFQMGMGQLEGLKKYRALRKDRARMLSVINEKRAAGEVADPAQAADKKKKK